MPYLLYYTSLRIAIVNRKKGKKLAFCDRLWYNTVITRKGAVHVKIAIATENPDALKQIGDFLRRYYDIHNIPAEIAQFSDPTSLVQSIRDKVYSMIILDMEGSGVALTYRIRALLPHAPVLLLRRWENGGIDCIYIHPRHFVLNELSERSFMQLMDSVRGLLYSTPECTLVVNTVQNLDRIVPLTDIIYAESMGHRVFLHLTSGEALELQGPIRMLADRLSGYAEFLFPHRSYIVNAFYVSCITPTALYLRTPHMTIPIARGKLESVKEAYDAYFRAFGRDTNIHNPSALT